MNENINLVEILKGCPKGTSLYSSILGEVIFEPMRKTFIAHLRYSLIMFLLMALHLA